MLLSAVFFSLHILTVDRVAGQLDGVALSCVQFFVAGVLSTVLALFLEKPDFSGLLQAWGPLLYTGGALQRGGLHPADFRAAEGAAPPWPPSFSA